MPVYAVLSWVGKKDGEGLMAQGGFPEWIMGSGGYSVFRWLQFYRLKLSNYKVYCSIYHMTNCKN